MQWNEIVGHHENINRLRMLLHSERMPHALLFTGPAGIGKMKVANTLSAAALCSSAEQTPCGVCQSCRSIASNSHPDLLTVRTDGTTIKIEQIRQLQSELAFAPYLENRRVCIIEDAERMTAQAANSILKTLEEPQGSILFILISASRQLLLETIISRCLAVAFQPLPQEILIQALCARGFAQNQAAVAARLSGGKMGKALTLLEPEGLAKRDQAAELVQALPQSEMKFVWNMAAIFDKLERRDFLSLLEYLSLILRDMLMIVSRQDSRLLFNIDLEERLTMQAESWSERALIRALKEVTTCRQALQANANPRLTGEALLIKLRDLAGGG